MRKTNSGTKSSITNHERLLKLFLLLNFDEVEIFRWKADFEIIKWERPDQLRVITDEMRKSRS